MSVSASVDFVMDGGSLAMVGAESVDEAGAGSWVLDER